MVCVKLVAMAIYEVKKACGNDNVPPVYLLSVYAKYSTFLSIYLCQDCFSIEDYKGPCQGLASTSILTKANDNGWPQFLINIDANQLKATKIQIVILSFLIWSNRAAERTICVPFFAFLKEWLK